MRIYLELAAVMAVWSIVVYIGFFVLDVPMNILTFGVAALISAIIGWALAVSQNKRRRR